ncbi:MULTISPECIES: VWA domain-containing protein [Pseudidiomarina]|uniref:Ca-activated chloride channel family protein n=2 Tax=Pseudidiomarina TaxID=2800384 RepID=A0A368V6B4_9GAMM|nr:MULTISPECIES: VWA domain-containing protein [Pseudidiomarina]PWW16080.1 Ca-activated chloride channel family protein [Pseudidiomarina maritima]RBP93410.1 Ca-activated chloride channel family protein [Pseudidiomarina tainanensis]RCW35870.1 Ca-activated chloride channel family protein [Pseudidiomarina tainanensis]
MIEFAWWWAALLWPLPWLVWQLLPAAHPPLVALRLPVLPVTAETTIERSSRLGWRKWLAGLIWTLLVLSLMQPQWLGEPVSARNEGREMILAIDLSGSMEIADMEIAGEQVDRLTMVKHVMGDFIARRVGDRLGLILFADTAYVQAPMSYDRDSIKQLLDEAELRLIGERTAIGDAIALSVKRFIAREQSNKIIILLTDGQNTAGNVSPEQALQLAQYHGVKIYAIGVGAEEVIVEGYFGQRRVNPSRDLDEDMLRNLANSTGGEYFRARSTSELEQIYQRLDEFEPIQAESQQRRPQTALFFWPLGLAWAMMLLAGLLPWLLRRFRPAAGGRS